MLHSVSEEQCVRANSPPRCDGHHKMSDWVPSVNQFTVNRGTLSYVWRHQRRMDKIMSRTNDTKFDHTKLENRVLADRELDVVTGGMLYFKGAQEEAATSAAITKAVDLALGSIRIQ